MKKTIFITSFHPLISRNILGTPLLEMLRERGIRVVLLAPERKEIFFRGEFGARAYAIEACPTELAKREKFLRYLALASLDTSTMRIKRKTEMRGSGSLLSSVIANTAFGRFLLRSSSRLLTPRRPFDKIFDAHNPDLVFSTDIQNEFDVRIMQCARDRNVPAAGMIRSWDNLSSKGGIRILPDMMLLHNEIEKKEAAELHGVPERIMRVIGIPHYDAYFGYVSESKEEFFRKIGADPSKRIVLFAPTGDRYLAHNTVDADIVRILEELLPPSHQLLVRLPPTDAVKELEGRKNTDRVLIERPSALYSIPKKIELSRKDDEHLRDTLYWSDLVLTGPSTMCIDAALFDKPVILIGFDGRGRVRPYYESVRRYYDYAHFKAIRRSGGVRLAESEEELASFAAAYLRDPAKDHENRVRMVEEQCGFKDTHSAERLSALLISLLEKGVEK